jgi:hypothetical protein
VVVIVVVLERVLEYSTAGTGTTLQQSVITNIHEIELYLIGD